MNKLIAAFSLSVLFISGTYLVSAQTNLNCIDLLVDMGIGATDATTGGQVTKLQNFLIARDFLRVKSSADLGTYGPQTARGVAQFQKGHGIIATGYVGPITRSNIQTITCAIGAVDTSTLPTTTLGISSLPLLTYTSPVSGALVVKGEKDITPDWIVAANVKTLFAGAVASIKTELIDSTGAVVGVLGNQVKITAKNNNKIETSFIRILKGKGGREDNAIDPGQYRLRATLVYGGTDTALTAAAARYASESGWFSVVNPTPQPNIKFSVSPEFLTAAGTTTLTWSAATSSVCALFNGSATSSIAASGVQIVNVAQSTAYRIECSLTSAWPFAGNSYTTTEKKDREVQIITGSVTATIASALVAGSPKAVTFTGTTNAPELGVKILDARGTVLYTSDSMTIRNGEYSKTISLGLFGGVEGQQYTIKLYGPTAITGSIILASKTFTASITAACSSGQTWNGTSCVTTPVCSSVQTLTNGVCVNNSLTGVSAYYNFVASTKAACESSIVSRSLTGTCTLGGGCALSGGMPSTINPSANPTLWGACIPTTAVATSTSTTTTRTPTILSISPTLVTLGKETSVALRGQYLNATSTLMVALTGPGADTSVTPTSISADGTTLMFTFPSTISGAGTYVVQLYTPGVAEYSRININAASSTSVSALAPPIFSAICARDTKDTYKITLKWNKVAGATNYPVRLKGPSFASNAMQFEGASVVGFGAVGDSAPTGTSYTFKLTGAGVYTYWGHAWSQAAGWSTQQGGTVTCSASIPSTGSDSSGGDSSAGSPTVLGVSAGCVDLPYNFHRGNESQSVVNLQTFLIARGYLSGEVTGFYGDKTVEAIKTYQGAHNLPATGMVYDFTRAAIKADSCQ